MKSARLAIALTVSAFCIAACALAAFLFQPPLQGSGVFARQARPLHAVERVRMSGFGQLIIQQGAAESLSVEGDDNLLSYFSTASVDGTLDIHPRPFFSFQPSQPLVFRLTVRDLKSLDLSGFADVKVLGLEAGALQIQAGEFSQLEFSRLRAAELSGQVKGFSRLRVDGQVRQQRVQTQEQASYQASQN